MASDLRQIDHLGSFACRNITIVNRRGAVNTPRRTRWTSAVSVWRTVDALASCRAGGARLRARLAVLLSSSCHYFGNALGPEYNAAHANHFHFGMRGQGFCF